MLSSLLVCRELSFYELLKLLLLILGSQLLLLFQSKRPALYCGFHEAFNSHLGPLEWVDAAGDSGLRKNRLPDSLGHGGHSPEHGERGCPRWGHVLA